MSTGSYRRSVLSKVQRDPDRGFYSTEIVHQILDEGFICHVAFTDNEGNARCIPTGYARKDDMIYLHGAAANFMLGQLASGSPLCIVVTLLDGFVLAKSIFNHSFNYRSVVIYGETEPQLDSNDEKVEAMRIFSEAVIPNRWQDCRLPNDEEINATKMLKVKIIEASAKMRTGPPSIQKGDERLPFWTGVMHLRTLYGPFEPFDGDENPVNVPEYLKHYHRHGAKSLPLKFGAEGKRGTAIDKYLCFVFGALSGIVIYRIVDKYLS